MQIARVIVPLFASLAVAQPINGLWDAVIDYDDCAVPFQFEFIGNGAQLKASFFNGDEKVTSTSSRIDGNTVAFRFDDYATELRVTPAQGALRGVYGGKRGGTHPFEAKPHRDAVWPKGPDIAGIWVVPTESAKGEHAWHLIVATTGAEISAAVLRVDGDTGTLTGHYDGSKFVLSHFDGARPLIAEITPREDGTLALALKGPHQPGKQLVAVRAAAARTEGLPQPDDPAEHTGWKDPEQPLQFSYPDLDGHIISNTDARFKGKVLIVTVTGSWCPNCHDEAPFLVDLYRRYHSLGLEMVALDFEEPEQLETKTRPRAFVAKYGIKYPFLLAGDTKDLQDKIPQAENLNCWPTTFFIGRDGKVRAAHAGFAAAASGDFHAQLERDVTGLVERLLAERTANASALRK